MRSKVDALINSRVSLLQSFKALEPLGLGSSIGSNDANFVLVPILAKSGSGQPDSVRAHKIYKSLAEENGVVVRFRGTEPGCDGCLRITIGSEEENKIVLKKLEEVLREL